MRQSILRTCQLTAIMLTFAGCETGVEGGASALTTRFAGISAVQAISPSSVSLTWTPQSGYVSYSVFISSQDTPLVSLPLGSAYTVNGLLPNTTYAFSVVGTSEEGNQYGMAKQLQATTWGNFLGPVSATAIDGTSVSLLWNYNSGPLYNVYVSTNPTPTISSGVPPTLISTPYTTSSQTGYTVSGLSPNTTYYFMAAARFPDGTDSLNLSLPSSATQSAVYVTKDSSLILEPLIVTAKTQLTNLQPIFTISGSVATLRATFEYLNNDLTTWTSLGQFAGNGNFTPVLTLPAGSRTIKVTIRDLISNTDKAVAVLDDIVVTTISASNSLKVVSATTPSGLSPIPTITTNAISLGSYPSFTISGAQPGYVTSIYNPDTSPDTLLATLTGNGTVKTLTSVPLPQGAHTLYALVSYSGLTARIDDINVRVKNIDAQPIHAPVLSNGGVGNQGFGRVMAVGDYNCDGYPDLASSAPYANGVYVYYGSASGLDYSTAPVTSPASGKPLYIPAPSNLLLGFASAQVSQTGILGFKFGATLASGNFNGDSAGGRACSDLTVGVPGDGTVVGANSLLGSVATYYGSTSGLQVSTPLVNSFGCVGGGSNSCSPVLMRWASSGVTLGAAVPIIPYNYEGMGAATAAGDIDGDGYDDLITAASNGDYTTTNGQRGFMFLYKGTANGLAPSFTKISPPALLATATSSSYFGDQIVIGNFNPSVRTAACGAGNEGVKDIAISFRRLPAGTAGITNPTTQAGFIVVPGCKTGAYMPIDGSNLITQHTKITPPTCNTVAPVVLPAGWTVSNGIACGTTLNTLIAADVNKDTYDDLVFSDPWNYAPGSSRGSVYVYYGTNNAGNFTTYGAQATIPSPLNACAAGNCPPQVFYTSDANLLQFGSSLAKLGDATNDGYVDIGIGVFGATTNGQLLSGRAMVFRGGVAGLTSTASIVISPNKAAKAYMGSAIAGAKFNSNTYFTNLAAGTATYSDVAVSAVGDSPNSRANGVQSAPDVSTQTAYAHGTVSLFTNASGLPASVTSATAVLAPSDALHRDLGIQKAMFAGDLNGDGYAEVAVPITAPAPLTILAKIANAYAPLATTTQMGMVIYSGSSSGLITTETVLGVTSVIAPSFNPVNPTDPLLVLDSLLPGYNTPYFASLANSAGDVNGDGYGDLLVTDAQGTATLSHVALFYGSANGLVVSPYPRAIPFDGSNRPSIDPMIVTTANTQVKPTTQDNMPLGTAHHYTFNLATGDFNGDGYGDFAYNAATVPLRTVVVYGSAWGIVGDGNLYVVANGASYTAAATTSRAQVTPNCSGDPQICTPLLLPDTSNNGICDVIGGGDMDGDGTDDLVSINCDDSSFMPVSGGLARKAGTVSIFYGSHSDGIHPDRWVNLRIEIRDTAITFGRYLGGPQIDLATWAGNRSNSAGDINGDGLGDIVLPAYTQKDIYVIYGVPGPGSSPTASSGAYIQQGLCVNLPCTLNVTGVATADYAPNHVLTVSTAQPNSCSSALRSCNVMRFTPSGSTTLATNILSAIGLGDVTGDSFSDVIVSSDYNPGGTTLLTGHQTIYSGSANGLQVTATASTKPNCVAGLCGPMRISWPTTLAQYPAAGASGIQFIPFVTAPQKPGDVDGDGKNDLLITSGNMNSTNLSGVVNGITTGGIFLFH